MSSLAPILESSSAHFKDLSPDRILDAVESLGYQCDGRLIELNSFENRVYQIGIEDEPPLIGKFYRPGRWSDEQILEEHDFTLELVEAEIHAIAPIQRDNTSLFESQGYRFALYKRQGGHPPELEIKSHIESIGRTISRIHAVGQIKRYKARPDFPFKAMGTESADYVAHHHIPPHYKNQYQDITNDILAVVQSHQTEIESLPYIRLHGDCHLGNILWQAPYPFFVDFDDSCNGPQIADLWMLIARNDDIALNRTQLHQLLRSYEMFNNFDNKQLKYIETFRSLRMINYTAWIGTRWDDPAFQRAFDWYNSDTYWQEHIEDLKKQLARMIASNYTLTVQSDF